jgi:drug/metabolite transporter (DMT)-like permease
MNASALLSGDIASAERHANRRVVCGIGTMRSRGSKSKTGRTTERHPIPIRSLSMDRVARDPSRDDQRETALAQALFVTFLWATSWVLIKVGLHDPALAPLTFAGLRYTIAALVLLPFAYRGLRRARPDRRTISYVVVLGVLFYAVTQGAQFVALGLLPAAAVALILLTSPVATLAIGAIRGAERPAPLQLAGIFVLLVGAVLYFLPLTVGTGASLGLAIATAGTLASASSIVLGRQVAREATERLGGTLPLTAVSMLIGGILLLGIGTATSGLPRLDRGAWTIVLLIAAVNTAFAFALWNHALRTLTAIESNVMNNTLLLQIALLAWVFLAGESLSGRQLLGIALAAAGIALVQIAPLILRRSSATL